MLSKLRCASERAKSAALRVVFCNLAWLRRPLRRQGEGRGYAGQAVRIVARVRFVMGVRSGRGVLADRAGHESVRVSGMA